jgi:hypothetical protein
VEQVIDRLLAILIREWEYFYDTLELATYMLNDPRYDMTDSASPSASLSLSDPIDLQAALDRAGIEYVSVHEQRLLAIYRTGIFNVVTKSGSVSSTRAVEVACWEGPLPSHTAGTSPQELLDDFTSVFEHGSTQ